MKYYMMIFSLLVLNSMASMPQQRLFGPHTYMVSNDLKSKVPVIVSIRAGDGGPSTQVVFAPKAIKFRFGTHIIAPQYPLRIKATRNLADTQLQNAEVMVLATQHALKDINFISFAEGSNQQLTVQFS